jgi:hypothetical protein
MLVILEQHLDNDGGYLIEWQTQTKLISVGMLEQLTNEIFG